MSQASVLNCAGGRRQIELLARRLRHRIAGYTFRAKSLEREVGGVPEGGRGTPAPPPWIGRARELAARRRREAGRSSRR